MAERRVSVRLAAVGGDRLKADLVAIGREGKAALAAIAGGSAPASHGLAETSAAARTLVTRLEAVSARAGAAAATMRGLEAAGGVVARIDRTDGGHRRPAPRRRRHRGLRPGARRHPREVQSDVRRGEELSRRARGDPGGARHRRDLGRRDERGDRPDEDCLARLASRRSRAARRRSGRWPRARGSRRCRAGCCSTSSTTSACRSPSPEP